MRWDVLDRRTVYSSWFVELHVDRVHVPGGRVFDHEVVSVPCDGAAAVVTHPDNGVLMIYRHRFITDRWGWEIPGGMVDPGEEPVDAAARELREETGWTADDLRPLTTMHPSSGLSDQRFHLFLGSGAHRVGEPTDPSEASRVEWRSWGQVIADLRSGQVPDGLSQLGLMHAIALAGRLGDGDVAITERPS